MTTELYSTSVAKFPSGALAYGITSGHSRLANWRLLFLVEGLPTILMAGIAFFYLPDSPDQARFLSEEEKVVAKARGVRQVGDVERLGGIVWKDVWAALLDAKCWLTAVRPWQTSQLKQSRHTTVLTVFSSCTSALTLASRRSQVRLCF